VADPGDVSRTSRALALAAAAGAIVAAAPSAATAALTATGVSLAGRPAFEQVVVPFAGGTLTGLERQTDATDPAVADGRAVVRVNGRGITARPVTRTRGGVTARLVRRTGSVLVVLDTPTSAFKFVSYGVDGSRTRLVIRLWRATVSPAARVLDDGCLRLTSWNGHGGARASGRELRPLFEHALVLSLRAAGAGGATLAETPLTATEGTFLPDFSGYATPGRWTGRLRVTLGSPGGTPPGLRAMLEAWSTSAKDGSLECLVQTPVILRP
jgi:hypothetical protein